jgi:hypothetical protein
MRLASFVTLAVLTATSALADDHALITQHMQDMANALVPGDVRPWEAYLDPQVVYAEEDGSFKDKAGMLREVQPMPKGLGGEIRIELLSYSEDGDTAVALFRQHEIERYYGQTIHASYLTNTAWKKRGGGWKMIAAETLAERTDPPALATPPAQLAQYAGSYKLKDSDPVYALAVTDGKLMGTRGTHAAVEWKEEAPDIFFIPGDPRIRKIFQRDASGRIVGFVERRESWDIVWVKQ